jgi:tetratricopeptide (TPR) repeat protein
MKKISILMTLICVAISSSFAQVRTPSPSPAATVMQTVGVTDMTVKYSRPSMKGREIFGKLIAFDKVWRTGANQATQIETSTDLMVEGQKLAAGKYAIMSIPGASEWTVIFSKNLTVNEGNYKQEEDALRVKVAPATVPAVQSFTIGFSDITDSTAHLNFAWETTNVVVKLMTETATIVEASIDKAAETSNNQMTAGANYLLSKGKNLEKALTLANQATGLKETFRNLWTKAQILSKLGRFAEAAPLAQKALDLGNASNDPSFAFVKDAITKGLGEYTSKIPALPALPGKKKK